ncbi:MAG: hypothetical protein ILM98_16370 [Kiritimatiellae bacterium]|nr:hypothetical protein [Kiritimatiellia bacterium]
MKHSLVIITAAVAMSCAAACTTPATGGATSTYASASLKDGSSIRGEFRTERIHGSTAFLDKLDIDPEIVKAVVFTGTNGEAKVELANGDRFAMSIANESFAIKSLLGELDIPLANFRSISLSQRKAVASCGEDGLVFHCTFDDEGAITTPVVGPKGTFLQGRFMQGKFGQALKTTVYSQNATFALPANFFKTSGCIEFWAKILKPSPNIGSGGDPRLFTITQRGSNNTICTIDIVSNNGGGNSGFSTWTILGNMASLRGCRSLRYENLFPSSDYRDWHHYAVVWDTNGISNLEGEPKMALLVDGELIPDIQNHARSTEDALAIISTPTLLSFTHDPDLDPEFSTKSPFLIDEFKIWSFAKTDFEI